MRANSRQIMRSAQDELDRLARKRMLLEHGWNSEKVLVAVVDAFRTLGKLPDRSRHKVLRSAWPDDTYAKAPKLIETEKFAAEVHAIALGEEEIQARQAERNFVIVPPTPVDIDRMSIALVWPARYIEDRAIRVVLMQCSVVRAADKSLRKLCRDRGWPYEATFARCRRAGKIIAARLNEDGVATWTPLPPDQVGNPRP